MKTLLLLLALCVGFGLICAVTAFGQAAAPAAGAPATAPRTLATPPAAPRVNTLRPVPSILPMLRLIDSGNLTALSTMLGLTDDQKAKVQDILTALDRDQMPIVQNQVKASSQFVDLLGKDDAKAADLNAAAKSVLDADSEILAGRIKALTGIRAILTPEQNKKLSDDLSTPAKRWLPQTAQPLIPASAPAAAK